MQAKRVNCVDVHILTGHETFLRVTNSPELAGECSGHESSKLQDLQKLMMRVKRELCCYDSRYDLLGRLSKLS
jgi:hypothetical protein